MDYDRNPYSGGCEGADRFSSLYLLGIGIVLAVLLLFLFHKEAEKAKDTRTPEEIQKAREQKADNAGKVGHSFLKGLAEGK